MTIHQQITAALSAVFPNSWAIELPPDPAFPALVFDVDTEPEERWCMGGGYSQDDVVIVVVARTMEELDDLLPMKKGGTIRPALEALPTYMWEEGCADADYDRDPELYARSLHVRLRSPLY